MRGVDDHYMSFKVNYLGHHGDTLYYKKKKKIGLGGVSRKHRRVTMVTISIVTTVVRQFGVSRMLGSNDHSQMKTVAKLYGSN